jgi:RHS repeat-associated protein
MDTMAVLGYDDSANKFTGKERDAETGLDYFGARYLSSAQGRWMSPDWSTLPSPIPYAKLDQPQSLNLYAYVENDPLSEPDIDGHSLLGRLACSVGFTSQCEPAPAAAPTPGAPAPPGTARLGEAQDKAMEDPNLQPGANGQTSHCSTATCEIARSAGANTTPLGPAQGGNYNANTQAANLEKAAKTPGSGWQAVPDLQTAATLATQGYLVVYAWKNPNPSDSGHTVTGAVDPGPQPGRSPMVAQVGGSTGNGVMGFRDAFGASKRAEVKIYVAK